MCETLDISPITSPRACKPPQRFTGCAPAHKHASPIDYYRAEFYKILDVVDVQFHDRFLQEGMQQIRAMEQVLLTGKLAEVVKHYPELNPEYLSVQLAMFRSNYTFKTSREVANILKGMSPEVRGLFNQVETLVRLLLVIPVSSAEAERSFSGLRRLKTWLRSTMTQTRLNSVAVCHVQKHKLDLLDRKIIAEQFVCLSDQRQNTFGSFK